MGSPTPDAAVLPAVLSGGKGNGVEERDAMQSPDAARSMAKKS
jgi:hypothetical protein